MEGKRYCLCFFKTSSLVMGRLRIAMVCYGRLYCFQGGKKQNLRRHGRRQITWDGRSFAGAKWAEVRPLRISLWPGGSWKFQPALLPGAEYGDQFARLIDQHVRRRVFQGV